MARSVGVGSGGGSSFRERGSRRFFIEQAADVGDLGVVVAKLADLADEVVFQEADDRRVL